VNAPRADDARTRLPREPYPGLRPFLDFEAALLFGRERQVREVIEHLKSTQFVAVLGGSGSGKSSLIHAGVVPELRSYGIAGAGDLWLPMTCTPGTNVSAQDKQAGRHSPITRLARRFGGLLRSLGNEAADLQRETEIAQIFRQEAGFARLLETYGTDFALPPGPDPADARVLFVLDQFEELFHPTNRDVADVALLVERVLDHFFNPHERCYVVLTMRSEHLNDCATYLELPDAINKSSYLIRRLDGDELRSAITGPAQRFLRLATRSAPPGQVLPAEVVFEEAVLQRLLRDVQSITHDPDHLPLLQHLLARLWEAALERQEMDVPVPDHVTVADLARAVQAGARGHDKPLDTQVNTLRACVENWPETLYQWHDENKRVQFDSLFRHLAFKDPNTGLYSQQRIDVDVGAKWLGPDKTRADLRDLISEGFLGSVDYLFWDDEDAARVTLKVSHESFIRGWPRFRALIDTESAHFDEFLGVLRKCADWSASGRSDDDLLEAGELRRLGGAGFAVRVKQPDKRETWRRFLALDRDCTRLAQHEPSLDRFFDASTQRQAERRARETRAKRSARWLVVLTVVFALLPTALFSVFVQGPTMSRAELLFDAGNRANRTQLSTSQPQVGAAAGTLDSLLRAAELIEAARQGEGSWRMASSSQALQLMGNWPPFSEQRDFLARVFTQAEPPVNGNLRQLLTGSLWRAPPAPEQGDRLAMPDVLEDTACAVSGAQRNGGFDVPGADQAAPRGRLFVSSRRGASDGRPLRALFLPRRPAFDRTLEVFSAGVDPVNGQCLLGAVVLSSPEVLDSSLVFDAGLRYFYYTVQDASRAAGTVIVQEVDWERSRDGELRALQRQTLATISDPGAVRAVQTAAGQQRVAVVPTWRLPGGRQVQVADRAWRIVSAQALRVDLAEGAEPPRALQLSAPGSVCKQVAGNAVAMPGFVITQLETGSHCFMVARGWPAAGAAGEATRPARDELLVLVHEKPVGDVSADALLQAGQSPPAPVAALLPFGRVAADAMPADPGSAWFVAESGPHAGWLLLKTADRSGGDRFIGLPWSTCALWRQGRELQARNPPAGGAQAGGSVACDRR